jgi:lipoprotein-anchoring transpeptidase ErfK/SrfK
MIENPSWQSPWTGEVFAPGANSALGLRWIGFAEMSNGIIGFHGTPTVSSIGRAASNGCVRLRNEDVLALYSHVRMGMTVVVEP